VLRDRNKRIESGDREFLEPLANEVSAWERPLRTGVLAGKKRFSFRQTFTSSGWATLTPQTDDS